MRHYLCDDHEGEESGECEHHARVLGAGAAAAEEAEDEDDGAQDDEEDGGVDVGVVKVVQVVGHLKFGPLIRLCDTCMSRNYSDRILENMHITRSMPIRDI